MDGGSSIDILFRSSLFALKLTQADLKPYDASFWGVLPGQSSIPLGQITLPMQFGNPNHFRTDYVNFMVTDFEGTYHAILVDQCSLSSWMCRTTLSAQNAYRAGHPYSQRQCLHFLYL
jgi:hypothetical protein